MAITLILLGDDLPDNVLNRAQNGPLKRTKIGMTGQNKVWLSGIAFMKGHKSFWRSEMAIHRTKDWYASVKMSSTRMIGAETCNSENMQGLHEGDGTLLLYQTGKEYEDIVPLWDWNRLPGTTCDQKYGDLTPLSWNKGYGNSDFSGVLGDGKTGMAAMIYKRANLSAKKSYFFTDKEIVCLGSDISGTSNGEVLTSVQQTWLTDDLTASKQLHQKGKTVLIKGDWVFHKGFGYYLMNQTTLEAETVKGNWNTSYPDRGNKPASGDVFSLWINHGKSPKNESYAYKIYPNISLKKMKNIKSGASIIVNTKSIQAIETKGTLMAVFYDTGQVMLQDRKTIKVNAPCLLILNKNRIFVSDPTHQTSGINIIVDDKTFRVNLPQGDEKGKAVSIIL